MAIGTAPPREGLLPAIGYVRVSQAREEMISPEVQRAASERQAAADGYYIAKWIEELDISGRGFGRKGVREAIADVSDGTVIDGKPLRRVYVWKYSRFGRNSLLNRLYATQMEEAGGSLVSATEGVDASTTVGKFTRGMIFEVDELQSNMIGDTWREAHARRRGNGLPHNGNPRFGYLYHSSPVTGRCRQGCAPGTCRTGYVPDPETMQHAAWMYEAYNSGMSVLRIATSLNGRALYTPAAKPWTDRMARKYMDSGFAAGYLRVHKPGCDRAHSPDSGKRCPSKVLIRGAHDAIISEETWREYLRQRQARGYLPPRVESPKYPLAGLVRCGRCGGPVNATGARDGHAGYMLACATYTKSRQCKGTWVARHRVEEVVLRWLREFAGDIDRTAQAERGRARIRQAVSVDRKRLEGQIGLLDRELATLTRQLAREVVPEDFYTSTRDAIIAEREKAAAALEQLAPPPPDLEPLAPIAAGLAAEWDTLPAAARRRVLGTLIDRIEVQSHGRGSAAVRILSRWGEVYFYSI